MRAAAAQRAAGADPRAGANEVEITRAGQFLAAFTLARVPLFLVVPLQTALLPMLTALLHSGDRAALRRVMLRIALGLVGLGVGGGGLGYFAGPLLVGLIFGESYVLGGRDVALLAVGVAAHIGLVLVTQVLVAAVRHRLVAWSWLSGVAVAAVILFTVPGPVARGRAGVPRRLGDGVAGRDAAGPHHRATRARTAACLTPPDDLAIALTYYSPYVSGPDEHGPRHRRGARRPRRRVTVVTSHFDSGLPLEEEINGVRVLRAPVLARVGRGVISPQLVALARKTLGNARVASLQLPMLEAGAIATGLRTPLVDLPLRRDAAPGLVNDVQRVVVDASNRLAMRHSVVVAVTSEDYAHHSRMWSSIAPSMEVVAPPCPAPPRGRPNYRETDGPHIGFLGRIVREKGLEHLVARSADPRPGGPASRRRPRDVAGGSVISQVRAVMGDDPRIRLLGFVPEERLGDFYASLDVFTLPR